MLGVLFSVQLFRDRISFPVRKGLTTASLIGLVVISAWATVLWYGDRKYAEAAVTAYLTLAFGGAAVWAATLWKPAPTSRFPVRSRLGAAVFGLAAGWMFFAGFSQLSDGYLPLAVIAWAGSALSLGLGVGAWLLDRRLRRQVEIAKGLGFDDLHAYYEARRAEGMSLEQMAAETGLKPGELERAAAAWKMFRLKSSGPIWK